MEITIDEYKAWFKERGDTIIKLIDERDQLRAELARCHDVIRSAKSHLERQDADALGNDPVNGYPYLDEMIYRFRALLEERPE